MAIFYFYFSWSVIRRVYFYGFLDAASFFHHCARLTFSSSRWLFSFLVFFYVCLRNIVLRVETNTVKNSPQINSARVYYGAHFSECNVRYQTQFILVFRSAVFLSRNRLNGLRRSVELRTANNTYSYSTYLPNCKLPDHNTHQGECPPGNRKNSAQIWPDDPKIDLTASSLFNA